MSRLKYLFRSLRKSDPASHFAEQFSHHPLFDQISASEMSKIYAIAHHRHLQAGELLFERNSEAHAAYLLLSGVVQIHQHDETLELGAGDVVGELGLLGQGLRDFQGIIAQESQILALTHEDLLELGQRQPDLMLKIWFNLARVLGLRLVGG